MTEPELSLQLPTPRELVRPVFRYRGAVAGTFLLVLAITIAYVARQPRVYVAEMKILVKRERVDPIVTSDLRASAPLPADISEAELYSEVELLKSRDLLERVVLETGLHRTDNRTAGPTPVQSSFPPAAAVAEAVSGLRASLDVEPVRRTSLISVAYHAPDPQLAARVLDRLAALYLQKHLTVHRPVGAHQFFTEQAARLQQELRNAEGRVRTFTQEEQVVSPADEKASALKLLSEFESAVEQTEASVADATRRLRSINAELGATPDRQVTQIRNAANVEIVRSLRSKILEIDIKRNELLQRFAPAYPPVMRLGEELDQLRDALASAEQLPLRDETTDRNPTYQWLRNEAARVRTERAALLARGAATRRTIAAYRARARHLESLDIEQQDLIRAVKAAEESYLLYQRKQEETRIADALDRTRIANVALAEAPTVPQAPTASRRGVFLLAGGVLAFVMSVGVAYLRNLVNPCFRTPDDVCQVLDVPVLASLPAKPVLASLPAKVD
jgi:uncharacterized protein involved in exopolysaccharide biosynthesis